MPPRNAISGIADPVPVAVLAALFSGIVTAIVIARFAIVPLVVPVIKCAFAIVQEVVLIEEI